MQGIGYRSGRAGQAGDPLSAHRGCPTVCLVRLRFVLEIFEIFSEINKMLPERDMQWVHRYDSGTNSEPRVPHCLPRSPAIRSQSKNNYFTEMSSGSEAGSYLRLIDFVYRSTLGLRVIKKRRRRFVLGVWGSGLIEETLESLADFKKKYFQKSTKFHQNVICNGSIDTILVQILNTILSKSAKLSRHRSIISGGAAVLAGLRLNR